MSSAVLRRPRLSPFGLNIITAVYMLALCNQGFWRSMNAALNPPRLILLLRLRSFS